MSAVAAPRTAAKKKTRWAIIAIAAVAVVALAIVVFVVMGNATKSAAAIATTTVEQGNLVVTASADGQTVADDTYDVYPEISGTVESVGVSVGDKVKAGEELFTVDDASLRSTVRQASASLSQAKQGVAAANQQVAAAWLQRLQARNALAKLRSMPASTPAAPAQINEAKRSITVADAGVISANASRATANIALQNAEKSYRDAKHDLGKAVVVAPHNGTVTSVNVAKGGSVSTGGGASGAGSSASVTGMSGAGAGAGASAGSSAPVVISDNSVLIAKVAVNEVDIADVVAGQEATVTFDAAAGLAIPAKVRWVSPNSVTSGNVRTYDVELELARQDKQLRPGMTASADIVTLRLDRALLIPKTSVRVDGKTKYVTVVMADGSQAKRPVTTGRSDETNVQALTNLKAGEKIATSFIAPATAGGGFTPPPNSSGSDNRMDGKF